ncbi:TPA: hypothetical protein ACH3X3_012457 [Trebouxia sp. C0006]
MSGTLEDKRAATKVVKSLGLQAGLRARAVVLVAADSTVGSSLRDLIQINEDDPALKALVEEFFRGEGTGTTTAFADHPFHKLSSNIEVQTQAVLQLGKAINSLASSVRAAKSTQFVYTPSNASSMRDPNFKLGLIKAHRRSLSCWIPLLHSWRRW